MLKVLFGSEEWCYRAGHELWRYDDVGLMDSTAAYIETCGNQKSMRWELSSGR